MKHLAGVLLALAVASAACSTGPTGPTAAARPASTPFGVLTPATEASTSAATCLVGSGAPSCFTAGRVRRTATTSSTVGAPILNNNQPVLVSGPTVTLTWVAPSVGVPISYVIEASDSPGGPANLANLDIGNTSPAFVAQNVGAGTYYVRVRARDVSGEGPASNEVQLIVSAAAGGCPGAPSTLWIVSQSGGNLTLGWLPPSSGQATSYVIQAGSAPGLANLANFNTGTTALTFSASNVPAGTYYVRVYASNSSCNAPAFIGPSSPEITLTIGAAPSPAGWSGQIVCRLAITGPNSYFHNETQTWSVDGVGQTSGSRTNYAAVWTAQGAGGAIGKSWTINQTQATNFSVTIVASTGLATFDRTSTGIVIPNGIVGTPTSFTEYEIDFPAFAASSPTATTVSGTWSRPTVGGDSPQQPSGSVGTLGCNWLLTYR